MYSFPNQKIVHIHREKLSGLFLGINKEIFVNAYRDLNATALTLYLFFASNKEGYHFAFSPAAVEKELGMPSSTCKDQMKKLIEKGYVVKRNENSNIYDFYEIPHKQVEQDTSELISSDIEKPKDEKYQMSRDFFDASSF